MPSATKVQTGYLEAVNPFSLTPGTASLPTLTFTNSPSTGMFSPSLGALAFSTSGTQNALTILTNGNVGIGSTNPQEKLHVSGSINTTEYYLTNGGLDYGLLNGYGLITNAAYMFRDYGGLT